MSFLSSFPPYLFFRFQKKSEKKRENFKKKSGHSGQPEEFVLVWVVVFKFKRKWSDVWFRTSTNTWKIVCFFQFLNLVCLTLSGISQGLLNRWTAHSGSENWNYVSWGRANLGPKLHPGDGFFGPWFFIVLTLNDAGFWEAFFRRNEICLIKFSFKWRSKYFIWKLRCSANFWHLDQCF